jgi:glycosyltransferase involved in cell wall biosynthesis
MSTERPRILQLGPDVPGGMSASTAALLASPLAERYRLEILATHRGAGAARRLAVFGAALARLTWWSLRGRGRIVHVHSTVRGSAYRKAVCVLTAKALRRRTILHMHSGPGDVASFSAGLSRPGAAFLRLAFAAADRVLAVSEASAAAISAAFAVDGILVVPNAAPAAPARAGQMVGAAEPVVAYLGGFANPVKGGEMLLAALARPELERSRVVLAGPGEPPAAAAELLAARPRIEWRGWLAPAEKEELLLGAAIFVLPSTSEGLPMALLEAMSHGLAIVATAVGGVPDTVDSGVEALVVPAGDAAALAGALVRLEGDAELRRRLGDGARARALEMRPERVAARLDALYRELLGSPA